MFSPPLKKSIVFLKYALKMDLVKGAWFDLYHTISIEQQKKLPAQVIGLRSFFAVLLFLCYSAVLLLFMQPMCLLLLFIQTNIHAAGTKAFQIHGNVYKTKIL